MLEVLDCKTWHVSSQQLDDLAITMYDDDIEDTENARFQDVYVIHYFITSNVIKSEKGFKVFQINANTPEQYLRSLNKELCTLPFLIRDAKPMPYDLLKLDSFSSSKSEALVYAYIVERYSPSIDRLDIHHPLPKEHFTPVNVPFVLQSLESLRENDKAASLDYISSNMPDTCDVSGVERSLDDIKKNLDDVAEYYEARK